MNLLLCDPGSQIVSLMPHSRNSDVVLRYSFASSHTVDLILQACHYCAEKGNNGKGSLDDWANRNWLFENETKVSFHFLLLDVAFEN